MTINVRAYVSCLCFIALSLVVGWPTASGAATKSSVPTNNVPVSIERDAQHLIVALTARGFEVTRGYFKLYTEDDCAYSYAVMKTCYGNNPAAPYVSFGVQPWPEEFVDPATKNAFGLTAGGYSGTFRLDPREAIVILGQLPPPAAYFGLQTYLFTREGTFDTSSDPYKFLALKYPAMLDSFFTKVPNNPVRIQQFASLSNSNNNVVVEHQSGSAFNQERFFIITPDRFMDAAVREALDSISVGDKYVFTEPIPSTMTTGLGEHADDFLFVMRYAMPHDGEGPGSSSIKWRKDLPLIVLRVRDTIAGRSPEPYGPPVLDSRTAADERWLEGDLNNLVAEVNRRWGQPCTKADCSDRAAKFIDMQSPPITFVGPECTKIGMNCLGDGQDTTYQATVNLSLGDGEIYAVAATLGTKTGNATYVGLSVNEYIMMKGIANIGSEQLKNTASAYAKTVKYPARFYLYYFTRDCSGLEALTGGNCFSITEEMIPVDDYFKLVQREYIRKGTERGPDSLETLRPMLIKLER